MPRTLHHTKKDIQTYRIVAVFDAWISVKFMSDPVLWGRVLSAVAICEQMSLPSCISSPFGRIIQDFPRPDNNYTSIETTKHVCRTSGIIGCSRSLPESHKLNSLASYSRSQFHRRTHPSPGLGQKTHRHLSRRTGKVALITLRVSKG